MPCNDRMPPPPQERRSPAEVFMGVERSHVVIDEEGRLAEVARKVKPAESATQALAALG